MNAGDGDGGLKADGKDDNWRMAFAFLVDIINLERHKIFQPRSEKQRFQKYDARHRPKNDARRRPKNHGFKNTTPRRPTPPLTQRRPLHNAAPYTITNFWNRITFLEPNYEFLGPNFDF